MLVTATSGSLFAVVLAMLLAARRPDVVASACSGVGDPAACAAGPSLPPDAPSVALPPLPSFGVAMPGVTVALFVDLGSAASRQVFQHVTQAIGNGRLDLPAELRLLQLPAGGCPRGSQSLGCLGARAVECAERLSPGTGVRAAGAVFDLQWRPVHERGQAQILAAVAGLVGDVKALAGCVTNDREVDARLAAHAALAAQHGLVVAPGGFVLTTSAVQRVSPFGGWLTEAALRAIVRCLADGRCEEAA